MERTNDQPVSLPVPHKSTELEQRGDSSSWDVDGLVKETNPSVQSLPQQLWWHIPIIPARWRQKGQGFKVAVGYLVSLRPDCAT